MSALTPLEVASGLVLGTVATIGLPARSSDPRAAMEQALVEPLRRGAPTEDDLSRVQRRRSFPTWATQAFQMAVQNRVIDPVLRSPEEPRLPWLVSFMQRWLPSLQGIPARIVGLGFRPEHVDLGVIDGRPGIPQ